MDYDSSQLNENGRGGMQYNEYCGSYLAHYGVKGMRWGVRKSRSNSTKNSKTTTRTNRGTSITIQHTTDKQTNSPIANKGSSIAIGVGKSVAMTSVKSIVGGQASTALKGLVASATKSIPAATVATTAPYAIGALAIGGIVAGSIYVAKKHASHN